MKTLIGTIFTMDLVGTNIPNLDGSNYVLYRNAQGVLWTEDIDPPVRGTS